MLLEVSISSTGSNDFGVNMTGLWAAHLEALLIADATSGTTVFPSDLILRAANGHPANYKHSDHLTTVYSVLCTKKANVGTTHVSIRVLIVMHDVILNPAFQLSILSSIQSTINYHGDILVFRQRPPRTVHDFDWRY